jgi:hypothetical protein
MASKIEEQLGRKQGKKNWIVFRATGYNPETKELYIHIEKITEPRWHQYLDEGKTYTFEHHSFEGGVDPLEMWELPTKQKKWVEDAVPEHDLEVLLYFWQNDSKLSIEFMRK